MGRIITGDTMDVQLKQELATRAYFLAENIQKCVINIRDNYIELGLYAGELKRGKLYKLLMPDAKNWEHFVGSQTWGIKRAQIDNYSQVALTIGEQLDSRDIPLNRALDITRIVNRLPAEEQEGKIRELIESAEALPKQGWEDTIRVESGKTPSDECEHLNQYQVTFCHKCQRKLDVKKITNENLSTIRKLEKAIHDIAPWLSASLNNESCQEYVDACNRIFELDKQ